MRIAGIAKLWLLALMTGVGLLLAATPAAASFTCANVSGSTCTVTLRARDFGLRAGGGSQAIVCPAVTISADVLTNGDESIRATGTNVTFPQICTYTAFTSQPCPTTFTATPRDSTWRFDLLDSTGNLTLTIGSFTAAVDCAGTSLDCQLRFASGTRVRTGRFAPSAIVFGNSNITYTVTGAPNCGTIFGLGNFALTVTFAVTNDLTRRGSRSHRRGRPAARPQLGRPAGRALGERGPADGRGRGQRTVAGDGIARVEEG